MTRRCIATMTLATTLVLNACDNTLGPDSVLSVEVQLDRTVLVEGENVAIGVVARALDGGQISGSEVTWISRDPTTARVEDGALFAVAPGVTRLVADVRGARDSVRIRVRFADLSQGEIGVRLQSDRGVRQAMSGTTFLRRHIALEGLPVLPIRTDISTRLGDGATAGSMDPTAEPDTLVWITFAGDPEVGAKPLVPFEVDTTHGTLIFRGGEGAIVSITDPNSPLRTELFAPVDGIDLEIDDVVLSNESGATGGTLRGAVAFEAAGIIIERDTANNRVNIVGPASETTLRVYAEFETDGFEVRSGSARVEVTRDGETAEGFTVTTARGFDGAIDFNLPVATHPGDTDGQLISVRSQLEATGPGTIGVEQLNGDTYDPRVFRAGTWSFAEFRQVVQGVLTQEPIGFGYSTSGDIVLSEFSSPTSDGWGLMRGTYVISYALRDGLNNTTGETMSVTAEFLLPILPLCGVGRMCN